MLGQQLVVLATERDDAHQRVDTAPGRDAVRVQAAAVDQDIGDDLARGRRDDGAAVCPLGVDEALVSPDLAVLFADIGRVGVGDLDELEEWLPASLNSIFR